MRILYVITGLGIGGAETITLDIANKMVQRGHTVALYYLTGANKLAERMDPRIEVVGLKMTKNLCGLLKALYKARKFIRRWQPDVVHSHMVHANLFCRILRLGCQMPRLISTEHSNNIEGELRMKGYRLTDFLSDMNTNVSREATDYFIRRKAFTAAKSCTVYNGIDLTRFRPMDRQNVVIREKYGLAKNDFVFLNVGRLMPAKDHFNLLNAFERLSKEAVNVKLVIVGEGDLRMKLEAYIRSKHLDKQVILAGSQFNMVDFYNASDCFVLSSVWEGFGIVLAEAMACELPVITTDAGGCREVVSDDEYVVKPKDPQALFQKMRAIYLLSSTQRKTIGRANRKKSAYFDLEHICDQWMALYSKK